MAQLNLKNKVNLLLMTSKQILEMTYIVEILSFVCVIMETQGGPRGSGSNLSRTKKGPMYWRRS